MKTVLALPQKVQIERFSIPYDMSLLRKSKVLLFDLVSGEARIIERLPFVIGGQMDADWKLDSSTEGVCNEIHFTAQKSAFVLTPHNLNQFPILLNGQVFENPIALQKGHQAIVKVGSKLLALACTSDPEKFLENRDWSKWKLFDAVDSTILGEVALGEVSALAASSARLWENLAISSIFVDGSSFWLRDLQDLIPIPQPVDGESTQSSEHDPATSDVSQENELMQSIPSDVGEFQCPVCWLRFEGRHIKHIATHPEMMGDSIKGVDHQRRFIPKQWDSSGIPLDDYDQPSPDLACPHCHERLPAGFGEFEQFIFSVVGAPASGKSYYLAILLKTLKRHLFRNFELSLLDQDPEYNISINDVINKLYSAKSAAEGRIIKTQMAGGTNYKTVHRGGQEVELPVPYIYNLSRTKVQNSDSCLVFYDNAGEHFLPSHSKADDFHILHVAKASALFFLYDPLLNVDVRRNLKSLPTKQLEVAAKTPDQQTSILAQMNVKISRVLGKSTSERLDVPFAFMIGKCDVWHSLVKDFSKIRNPINEKKQLDESVVDRNSAIMREFLNEYAPDVVATVERLSNEVRYFPISAFGHRPDEYKVKVGDNMVDEVAPDPEKINPYLVEIPTEWAISQVIPDLIPTA